MPEGLETASNRWDVPGGRRADLKTLNQSVYKGSSHYTRHNCSGVLYYPGALVDVLNPLFATYGSTSIYVFTDLVETSCATFRHSIHEAVEELSAEERTFISRRLGIESPPAFALEFTFLGKPRILLYYYVAESPDFLAINPGFQMDIFFDKDFWESGASNSLNLFLPRIKQNGFLLSNAGIAGERKQLFLEACGMTYVGQAYLNGAQRMYKKSGAAPLDADAIMKSGEDMEKAMQGYLLNSYSLPMDLDKLKTDEVTLWLYVAFAMGNAALHPSVRIREHDFLYLQVTDNVAPGVTHKYRSQVQQALLRVRSAPNPARELIEQVEKLQDQD